MRKIEILSSEDQYDLKHQVNKFIAEHFVADIQFQMAVGYYNLVTYAVMIIYEDSE